MHTQKSKITTLSSVDEDINATHNFLQALINPALVVPFFALDKNQMVELIKLYILFTSIFPQNIPSQYQTRKKQPQNDMKEASKYYGTTEKSPITQAQSE